VASSDLTWLGPVMIGKSALLVCLLLLGCQPPAPRNVPPAARGSVSSSAASPPRVAYLWPGPPPTGTPLIDVFRPALAEYGWEEGGNVVVESVHVENQAGRYPEVIARLVASRPDVIVVGDSAAAPLVAQATSEIPVVLTVGGNVVAAGQACSVNRPCGNITGLSLSLAPLSPKRLEMLKEIAPEIRRVGFLRNAGIPETELELEALRAGATMLGVEIVPLQFRTVSDFDAAFAAAVEREIDSLLVMPDGVTLPNRTPILRFTAEHGLPDGYGVSNMARDGGLFAYGADRLYNFRRAAFYVDRILRGTQPSELPIEQPARFELILNLARAQQLGLTLPNHLLLDASDVVR
jgi:putative tryptophan/tyrosine transport system substrate-binding protein